jgi:hypothetical protein
MSSSLPVATLGTPRIGPRRELKFALESFWSGKISENELLEAAAGLRAANWARQKSLGVTVIPSNDFSLYDHVLDTSVMVGAIPDAYGWRDGPVSLQTYFAMARGAEEGADACAHGHHGHGVHAQEMTKWFDTNYHYMVPELGAGQTFRLASRKPIEEYEEARRLGYETRPVLVGPVTFLKLAKSAEAGFDRLSLLDTLLPVYIDALSELAARGATWVQLDEPCLVLDLDEPARKALRRAYEAFAAAVPQLKIMLTTYFGALGDTLDLALGLPTAGLHLDLYARPNSWKRSLRVIRTTKCCRLALSMAAISGARICREFSTRWKRPSPGSAVIACSSRHPARCCMCRSISIWNKASIQTCAVGWPFLFRRWASLRRWPRRWEVGACSSHLPWRHRILPRPRARSRPRFTTRWCQAVLRRSPPTCARAAIRLPRAPGSSARRSTCRGFRRRRLDRSRRQRR